VESLEFAEEEVLVVIVPAAGWLTNASPGKKGYPFLDVPPANSRR